jgi:hypothetical protein
MEELNKIEYVTIKLDVLADNYDIVEKVAVNLLGCTPELVYQRFVQKVLRTDTIRQTIKNSKIYTV